jgi:hypothetical protein
VVISTSDAGIKPAAISPLKLGWRLVLVVWVSMALATGVAVGLTATDGATLGVGALAAGLVAGAGLGEALLLGLGASPPQPDTNNERQPNVRK